MIEQFIKDNKFRRDLPGAESGQVMIITVLVLTIVALSASAIATFLTNAQLRRARGIANSTKAIYAADSGIEYELYRTFIDPSYTFTFAPDADGVHRLTNNSGFTTTVTNSRIRSVGEFNSAYRAFSVTF